MFVALRLLLAGLLTWHCCAMGAEIVRSPPPEAAGDRRLDYPKKLLELALSKTKKDYQVVDAPVRMNQARQVLEIEAGRSIDVGPIPSSAERETRLLPIRIPLNKGLLGWRIGLIRKGDDARLAKVKTLSDLKEVRIAQGHEWPDTEILQGNGIQVITGSSYDGLFEMLARAHIDYFPRSVMEIWDELERHKAALEVESHVALHYFYDSYFFVNKQNTKLAEDIRQGMEAAISDGSFDKLFQEYWGEHVRRARLGERTVIELRNPLLTPQTPSGRPELWYRPTTGR